MEKEFIHINYQLLLLMLILTIAEAFIWHDNFIVVSFIR